MNRKSNGASTFYLLWKLSVLIRGLSSIRTWETNNLKLKADAYVSVKVTFYLGLPIPIWYDQDVNSSAKENLFEKCSTSKLLYFATLLIEIRGVPEVDDELLDKYIER